MNKDLITYKVSFTSTLDLLKDEILVGAQTEYRVIHVDTNTDLVYLQPTNLKYISPVGSLSAKNDMMRIYNCESVLIDPIVDKYTGRVLYSSNENPFAFNTNQGIVIRTFLEL